MKRQAEDGARSKGARKAGKGGERRSPSPTPRLSGSPARAKGGKRSLFRRGPGIWMVLYLRDPREKFLAALLRMEPAGVWVRGIELESFESWARERAADAESSLGLSSFFVPFLRVEKMVADEPMGPVASFSERFETITGRSLSETLVE